MNYSHKKLKQFNDSYKTNKKSMKFKMKRAVENKLKNIEGKFMLRQSERTIAVKFEM